MGIFVAGKVAASGPVGRKEGLTPRRGGSTGSGRQCPGRLALVALLPVSVTNPASISVKLPRGSRIWKLEGTRMRISALSECRAARRTRSVVDECPATAFQSVASVGTHTSCCSSLVAHGAGERRWHHREWHHPGCPAPPVSSPTARPATAAQEPATHR